MVGQDLDTEISHGKGPIGRPFLEFGGKPPHSKLSADEPWEFVRIIVEAGKDWLKVSNTQMFGEHLSQHGSKIRG